MTANISTLDKVLEIVESFSWDCGLYVARPPSEWSKDMAVVVLTSEEMDDLDEDVLRVDNLAFKYGLEISSVQDVVRNALAQKSNASLDDLVQALSFYYGNDSFYVFS